MKFIIIKCFDCNGFTFAIEEHKCQWIASEEHNDEVSEFCCPSCGNQIWKEDSDIIGEFTYVKE